MPFNIDAVKARLPEAQIVKTKLPHGTAAIARSNTQLQPGEPAEYYIIDFGTPIFFKTVKTSRVVERDNHHAKRLLNRSRKELNIDPIAFETADNKISILTKAWLDKIASEKILSEKELAEFQTSENKINYLQHKLLNYKNETDEIKLALKKIQADPNLSPRERFANMEAYNERLKKLERKMYLCDELQRCYELKTNEDKQAIKYPIQLTVAPNPKDSGLNCEICNKEIIDQMVKSSLACGWDTVEVSPSFFKRGTKPDTPEELTRYAQEQCAKAGIGIKLIEQPNQEAQHELNERMNRAKTGFDHTTKQANPLGKEVTPPTPSYSHLPKPTPESKLKPTPVSPPQPAKPEDEDKNRKFRPI